MATRQRLSTVDKFTAAISGSLAAAFFALAVVAAAPGEDPAAPVVAADR